MNIYDFEVKTIQGKEKSLADYKNKVLLIVNTASKCGFTPQFAGLEEIYKKYKDKGFEILGFPSNQFLEQDPASNEEISSFCQLNYGVSFQMFEKGDVKGENIQPLFKYLTEKKGFNPNIESHAVATFMAKISKLVHMVDDNSIKWNFTKFLIDKNGEVVERFEPVVTPEEIEKYIIQLL